MNTVKKKAATGLHPSDGQTENQDKEPINMNASKIIPHITPASTAPISEAVTPRARRKIARADTAKICRNLRMEARTQRVGRLELAQQSGVRLDRIFIAYTGRRLFISDMIALHRTLGLSLDDLFAGTREVA